MDDIESASNAAEAPKENENGEADSVSETKEKIKETGKKEIKEVSDTVCFNTGHYRISVVDREAFDAGLGDAFFEEDGSYTINIPEENPFFPYEVQFSYGDKTASEWFMSPDASVTVGGHVFHVSASFDGEAVTQMSLSVGGDTVVAYPERKTFTDGDGAMELSLLPLTEREMAVDLTGYMPAELSMVSLGEIFKGNQALKDTDKVMWSRGEDGEYYRVSAPDERINLSGQTWSYDVETYQMIVGEYGSIKEAKAAGAKDIKASLFDQSKKGGYAADYSKGVIFTVFIGDDSSADQKVVVYGVKLIEGKLVQISDALLRFNGLNDKNGNPVNAYIVDDRIDSYAEYNYLTILADKTADLTQLAPVFTVANGMRLYAFESSSPEVSGKSVHDFSKGPVQYTVSAENGKDSKNYWVRVLKAEENTGRLYINSLMDEKSGTRTESGIVYSTREVFLNEKNDYTHDILLLNVGTEPIPDLRAELVSDEAELDPYWTLKGGHELKGLGTVNPTTQHGELANMAKISLTGTELWDEEGNYKTSLSGTLTIKSGSKTLMVLNLTGIIGSPSITTEEIPDAVKYVPYGTMIQNSSKYTWNEVSYHITGGTLPDGMVIRPNGELYGVPKETGEFTFTVRMENSYEGFEDSEKTFTFTVADNTDANVDAATDPGYELTTRLPNFSQSAAADRLVVSEGLFEEFQDVFIDGVKLKRGEDYTAESGSTRITIRSQTLKKYNQPGTHTLGIEFWTTDGRLKRAAQNYRITANSGSSGSSSSRTRAIRDTTSLVNQDAKKGYVHVETGIVTGEGAGYSRWSQDANGWKLIYADGTTACGSMMQLSAGIFHEIIFQINPYGCLLPWQKE